MGRLLGFYSELQTGLLRKTNCLNHLFSVLLEFAGFLQSYNSKHSLPICNVSSSLAKWRFYFFFFCNRYLQGVNILHLMHFVHYSVCNRLGVKSITVIILKIFMWCSISSDGRALSTNNIYHILNYLLKIYSKMQWHIMLLLKQNL